MSGLAELLGERWAKIVLSIIALLVAGLIGADIDDDDQTVEKEPPPAEVVHQVKDAVSDTTVVDGADADAKRDDVIPVGPEAQEVVAELAVEEQDLAGDLVGDEPVGPVAELKAPFAAEEIPGCRTAFLNTNWSYRTVPQSMVIWYVPHYTAGRDIPNSRADVTGLTAYGNNPAARVSWNINMDKDGNCDYNVPLRYKSWAFGNANSRAINMEVHGSGEAPYLRAGGYKQLARIWKYVHSAYPQIKLKIGSVNNCGPGTAGWVTHWMGGSCSGGHTDIRPLSLPEVVDKVRAALASLNCDAKCKQIKRVRKRHKATHAAYQKNDCRGRMHDVRLRDLKRERCQKIKRRGHHHHLTLKELRG